MAALFGAAVPLSIDFAERVVIETQTRDGCLTPTLRQVRKILLPNSIDEAQWLRTNWSFVSWFAYFALAATVSPLSLLGANSAGAAHRQRPPVAAEVPVTDLGATRQLGARFSSTVGGPIWYKSFMLFEMPSDDSLYQALIARDPSFEGLAWVGVKSTGIFCRLTCPARKPRRENSVFFASVADCLESGFRPCKRCRPLASAGEADPIVRTLLDALETAPSRRWREQDIVALDMDPSTVRRIFKRHFGITFLEMARLRRVRNGAVMLSEGAGVLDAQLESGFESGSGFRAAFGRVLGRPPSKLGEGPGLNADWLETPLGAMIAVADANALYLLEFFDRKGLPNELKRLQARMGAIGVGRYAATDQIEAELGHYFAGTFSGFDTPIAQLGSEFTRSVWSALRDIPLGETSSYGDIAATVGRPKANRAVARANGANQIAIVIPCHRVIGADGSLTGYGGGLWRKRWLIDHERNIARR